MISWVKRTIESWKARRKARRILNVAKQNFLTFANAHIRLLKTGPDTAPELRITLALIGYGRDVRQVARDAKDREAVHQINNKIIEVARYGRLIHMARIIRSSQ